MIALFAGVTLSAEAAQQLLQQLEEHRDAQPAFKRSRTGWDQYLTLLTQHCDEVKLWNAEVLGRNVRAFDAMYLLFHFLRVL